MHLPSVRTLADDILELTGQHPANCYQCGKCSAGCPVRDYMDVAPNRAVRAVQLGLDDTALRSRAPWICAGCQTCATRCPQEFDLVRFMDALREIARRRDIPPSERDTALFHDAFLSQIRAHGKAYELGLIREYKLSSGNVLQDVDIAPAMFLKGKIGVFPHGVKDRDRLRRIFDRAVSAECHTDAE